MTTLRDIPRPLPARDNVSSAYWDGCAAGKLLIQRCTACGAHQFYPRAMCTACAGEPEWVESSGQGVVHTFTVLHQNKTPPWGALGPYVVAMVELDEGVRMMTNIIDAEPGEVRIGMRVAVEFIEAGEDVVIPVFVPHVGQGPQPLQES